MSKILKEGLDFMDLENQVVPEVSVDEYSAKMGTDAEIITLAFTVKGNLASEDLVSWFEKGYDYVLDAQVSDGEISSGKNLVFVEMNRRNAVPERIIEMLDDLETLTGLKTKDWAIVIDGEKYEADVNQIKDKITLSPHKYRIENDKELNEMRKTAGLDIKPVFTEKKDSLLKDFLSKAGL
jgi:hypothetical protein